MKLQATSTAATMNTAPSTSGEKVKVAHYWYVLNPVAAAAGLPGNLPKSGPNALQSVLVEQVLEVLQHLAPVVTVPANETLRWRHHDASMAHKWCLD